MGLTLILCCPPPPAVEKTLTLPETPDAAAAVELAAWTALMGIAMICRTPVCGFVWTACFRIVHILQFCTLTLNS